MIPIVLRGEDSLRFSLAALQRAQVYSQGTGEFVSLELVASIRAEWRTSRIKRLDQQRALSVEARILGLGAQGLVSALNETREGLDLPAGHKWELGGEVVDQGEANSNFFGLLPIAFGVIIATILLVMIGGVLGLVIMARPTDSWCCWASSVSQAS